jgi:serine protease Do
MSPARSHDLYEYFRRFGVLGNNMAPDDGSPSQAFRGQGFGLYQVSARWFDFDHHVVRDASEVTVKLTGTGANLYQVLGSDPKTDVAVLRIAAKGLPVVHLGGTHDGWQERCHRSPFGLENGVFGWCGDAKWPPAAGRQHGAVHPPTWR